MDSCISFCKNNTIQRNLFNLFVSYSYKTNFKSFIHCSFMGKLKRISLLILMACLCLFTSCDETKDAIDLENQTVIINNNLYKETATNNYTITDVQLNGNNLTIKISSSGCDSNSWKAVLIDANIILESFPEQRNIKLALENNEACLAVFEKEFTFDISILKENFSEITLNLEGWNTQINYK